MFRTYIQPKAGGQIELNWSPFYLGWILQVQTNSLATGPGAKWSAIPGSGGTNQVFISIDPTNGGTFFRLAFPN
jgi:hypothetical protein